MSNDDYLDAYPEGCYVAVTGSVLAGFKFWGPFTTMRSAVEWAERKPPFAGHFTIMPVDSPDQFPWKDDQCQSTTTDSTSTVE
jgi:hypothetical protein